MSQSVPHLRVIVFFCVVAVAFYAGFSVYIVAYTDDAALQGDIVGTWKSFATAAFFFWVGASSGGKTRDVAAIGDRAGKPLDKDPLDLTGAELPPTGERT